MGEKSSSVRHDCIGRMSKVRCVSKGIALFAFLGPRQCSTPVIMLIGGEVARRPFDRVSAPFALNANGVKPGSRPLLVGSKTGQRTRHWKGRKRARRWESHKEERMDSIQKVLVGIQGGIATGGPCLSTSRAVLETLGGGGWPLSSGVDAMRL